MDQKQKLESPSEQSRLLSEIPKVIPEMVDTNLSPDDSSRKDKLEQNDLPELAIEETYNSVEQSSTHGGFAQCLDKRTDVLGLSGFPIYTPCAFIYLLCSYNYNILTSFILCS
jgi:hypothetical protein